MKYIRILSLILTLTGISFSQYPNFRVHPSNNPQIEPSIVFNPTNPQIMFCSAYTISLGSGFRSEGIYISTNGGTSWSGTDTCSGAPISTGHGGDPGPIIDKDGMFILTHQGGISAGMFANYSTNMGNTWSSNVQILLGDQDKGSPFTDDVSSSGFYGRSFLLWTRFTNPFPIVVSYTTNSGISWSSYAQINNSLSGRQSVGPVGVVGSNGFDYVAWASADNSGGLIERAIGFAYSSNGGVNWNVQESIFNITGIHSSNLQPWGIRVNSYPEMDIDRTGGSRNGWIYIVVAEKNQSPAGTDPDVVLFRSTNGGTNWSSGVKVNQDALNNGKVQYFPIVNVDATGGVNVVYYDNRLSTGTSDSTMNLFLSRSTDGGSNWNDYRITNHTHIPKGVQGTIGNGGDNIGMTSANGKLIPVWMDNSTGIHQIWTALIDINTIGIQTISNEIPKSYSLEQNYPNPFNPSTRIRFTILKNNSQTSLLVYDMNGKEVSKLVDGLLNTGTYEAEFNSEGLSSGVYLYKLITEDYNATKKMILLK